MERTWLIGFFLLGIALQVGAAERPAFYVEIRAKDGHRNVLFALNSFLENSPENLPQALIVYRKTSRRWWEACTFQSLLYSQALFNGKSISIIRGHVEAALHCIALHCAEVLRHEKYLQQAKQMEKKILSGDISMLDGQGWEIIPENESDL